MKEKQRQQEEEEISKEVDKRIIMESGNSSVAAAKSDSVPSLEQIHIPKIEYDALVADRDDAYINLFMLGNNLREVGFQVADLGNSIQRLGNDIATRIKLSPGQVQRMQQQLLRQQQQQPRPF